MSDIFDSIEVTDEVKRFVGHSFDIVDQIHAILEKQGMSQRQLAERLGKRESEISKWMRGNHNFTLKSIAKIESVLGERLIVTPDKASGMYKTRMIPVNVYARENSRVDYGKVTTVNPWMETGKSRVQVA